MWYRWSQLPVPASKCLYFYTHGNPHYSYPNGVLPLRMTNTAQAQGAGNSVKSTACCLSQDGLKVQQHTKPRQNGHRFKSRRQLRHIRPHPDDFTSQSAQCATTQNPLQQSQDLHSDRTYACGDMTTSFTAICHGTCTFHIETVPKSSNACL